MSILSANVHCCVRPKITRQMDFKFSNEDGQSEVADGCGSLAWNFSTLLCVVRRFGATERIMIISYLARRLYCRSDKENFHPLGMSNTSSLMVYLYFAHFEAKIHKLASHIPFFRRSDCLFLSSISPPNTHRHIVHFPAQCQTIPCLIWIYTFLPFQSALELPVFIFGCRLSAAPSLPHSHCERQIKIKNAKCNFVWAEQIEVTLSTPSAKVNRQSKC